jgi:hypothetical protein
MRLPTGEIFDPSEVMTEFYKIAARDDQKDIEEKVLEVEDIIEKAHPEPVYVAEALGNGGLVENQNEQSKKMHDILNKMPTGTLVHNYASCFADLIKLAEECEAANDEEGAELVTELARGVLASLPFVLAP